MSEGGEAGVRPRYGELRIAIVSDAIPGRNGVGTYYDDLVRHLEDQVARVELIAPPRDQDDGTGHRSMAMPGDPTQRLYLPRIGPSWRRLEKLSPHVVVASTPGAYGTLGMAYALTTKTTFCVGYHTQIDQLAGLYWSRSLGPPIRSVLQTWDRVMFRCARCVLVHNATLLEQVSASGVRRASLVGTPTPHAFITEPVRRSGPEIRTLCFVGRLAPEKRLEQVMEVARAMPDLQVRIAGDGPQRDEVESWARELPNIEVLGWVGRDEVRAVLDDGDVLVLPSRYETFGSIALEAMARGRLAVVSEHCGISKWPELSEGLVVMEGDEPLVDTIRRLRGWSSAECDAVTARARLAAEALNDRTVSDWLEALGEAVGVRDVLSLTTRADGPRRMRQVAGTTAT